MGGWETVWFTGEEVERVARVELASLAWEARVIPIYDTRLGGDIRFSLVSTSTPLCGLEVYPVVTTYINFLGS